MRLYLMEGPTEPVVTLDEAKAHMRVEGSDEDLNITGYIAGAQQHIDGPDGWLGRALVSQTLELRLDEFCGTEIRIPLPPLIEVESIKYYDENDELQTLATSVYDVVGVKGDSVANVALQSDQSWPGVSARREAVVIRYRAGYRDTSASPPEGDVPSPIKQAILLTVGTWYMQRETIVIGQSVAPVPDASDALLSPFWVPYFGR